MKSTQTANNNSKFDFNDILLMPTDQTEIFSRSEISPYILFNEMYTLPIMTAPMLSVIDNNNYQTFIDNNVYPVISRSLVKKWEDKFSDIPMYSVSMKEFQEIFIENKNHIQIKNVLIDVANGHMTQLLDIVAEAKEINKKQNFKLHVMVGNIANPKTYQIIAKSGIIDYVRIGIGNGNGCLTTEHTGIGYPMASLISECYGIKNTLMIQNQGNLDFHTTMIVADGGMKSYSDIIKALALGADFVMLGSILNKAIESAGQNYIWNIPVNNSIAKFAHKRGVTVMKEFYGMSTKKAQRKLGRMHLRTSEGVDVRRPVEYTLSGWQENFKDYLTSAMSYAGAINLNQFIGKVRYNMITDNAYKRFNK